MTTALSRIRTVRERRLQQAASLVEARRRTLDAKREAVQCRDQILRTLEAWFEQVSGWLCADLSDPSLRTTALARMASLSIDRAIQSKARNGEAAALEEAAKGLLQARQAMARARARLEAVRGLMGAASAKAARRRDHFAELEQDDRRLTRQIEG